MSPELSSLVHLTSLELSPTASASLCGSIEATPGLRRLALDSTHCSHLLRSATLTSLIIGAHRVRTLAAASSQCVECFTLAACLIPFICTRQGATNPAPAASRQLLHTASL